MYERLITSGTVLGCYWVPGGVTHSVRWHEGHVYPEANGLSSLFLDKLRQRMSFLHLPFFGVDVQCLIGRVNYQGIDHDVIATITPPSDRPDVTRMSGNYNGRTDDALVATCVNELMAVCMRR